MTNRDVFGMKIPKLHEILQNQAAKQYIANTLQSVLEDVEDPKMLVGKVMELSNQESSEYEKRANSLLQDINVTSKKVAAKLSDRAEIIYSQIKEHLIGKSVLDYGCGDGKVGHRLAKEGLDVTLADVYKNNGVDTTGLLFVQFKQEESIPITEQYDNTLLLTVMHHSDDPIKTLQDAKRVTKPSGRIIVIESVYGIDDETTFGQLSSEEQRLTNIFFDHFYNRVIHYSEDPTKKVNVPFNFNTPENWKKIFEENGMKQITQVNLGIDQPTVPEYHTLHVVEV